MHLLLSDVLIIHKNNKFIDFLTLHIIIVTKANGNTVLSKTVSKVIQALYLSGTVFCILFN